MKGIFIPDCTQDEIAEIIMYARIGANNSMIGVHKHYISVEDTELPRWVPVSERLPNLWTVVLVTDESGNVFEYERRPLDENGNEYNEWCFLGRKIIAWQPLPEPYEPKEKENG